MHAFPAFFRNIWKRVKISKMITEYLGDQQFYRLFHIFDTPYLDKRS